MRDRISCVNAAFWGGKMMHYYPKLHYKDSYVLFSNHRIIIYSKKF